jgi:hypothetical protein
MSAPSCENDGSAVVVTLNMPRGIIIRLDGAYSVRALFVRQKSAVKTGALQIPDQWSGESHPGGEVLATFQAAYVASMHYTGLKTRALFSGAFSPSAPLSPPQPSV